MEYTIQEILGLKYWIFRVMSKLSFPQSETDKQHAGLATIWYCQSEWLKIIAENPVIFMFFDRLNIHWTDNVLHLQVIVTDNASMRF